MTDGNGSCASQCVFPADLNLRVVSIEEKLGVLDTLSDTIRERIVQENAVQAAQVEIIRQTIISEVRSISTALKSHISEQTAAERRNENKDKETHTSTVRVHERLDKLMDEMKELFCLVTDKHVALGKDLDANLSEIYTQVTSETDAKRAEDLLEVKRISNRTIYILCILYLIGGVLIYFQPTLNKLLQEFFSK